MSLNTSIRVGNELVSKFSLPRLVSGLLVGNLVFYSFCWGILAFLALVMRDRFGFSGLVIGSFLGGGALLGTIAGAASGYLSDRIGRKKIICGSMVLFSLLALTLSVSNHPLIFGLSAGSLFLAKSVYDAMFRVFISDVAVGEQKEAAYAIRFLTLNLGASIGPWLVVSFDMVFGSVLYNISSLAFLIYAFFLFFFLPDSESRQSKEVVDFKSSMSIFIKDRQFFLMTLSGTIFVGVLAQYGTVVPQYIYSVVGKSDMTIFAHMSLANSLAVVLSQIPVTAYFSRFDEYRVAALGILIVALGFLLMLVAPPSWIYVLAMVVIGVGETMIASKLDVIVDRIAPESLKGLYFGAFSFIQLGAALGPILGGFVFDMFGKVFLIFPVIFSILAFYLILQSKRLAK